VNESDPTGLETDVEDPNDLDYTPQGPFPTPADQGSSCGNPTYSLISATPDSSGLSKLFSALKNQLGSLHLPLSVLLQLAKDQQIGESYPSTYGPAIVSSPAGHWSTTIYISVWTTRLINNVWVAIGPYVNSSHRSTLENGICASGALGSGAASHLAQCDSAANGLLTSGVLQQSANDNSCIYARSPTNVFGAIWQLGHVDIGEVSPQQNGYCNGEDPRQRGMV